VLLKVSKLAVGDASTRHGASPFTKPTAWSRLLLWGWVRR